MRALFAHRDARLYIAGQTLSSIGDNSLWLAMGIWVKILTHSNSAAGLVFFAFAAGALLAPATGVLADRVRRRPLLVAANLAGAVLVCALLAVHGRSQVWLVYVVLFGYGAVNALITSAQTAFIPALVPDQLLAQANAALQVGSFGLRILTPLIGAGMLAAIGAAPVIWLDAATFMAAAACVLALSVREPRPQRAQSHWRAEASAGIRYVMRTAVLRRLLVTFVLALSVIGFLETIGFAIVAQGLHRTPPFLGVLVAVQGIGVIVGAVTCPAVIKAIGEVRAIATALALVAAGSAVLTISAVAAVVTGMLLFGGAIAWANIAIVTLIQRRTPSGLVGRVDSALTVAGTVPQVMSIALGAALIAVVGYRALLVTIAAVMAVCVAYLLTGRDDQRAVSGEGTAGPAPDLAVIDAAQAGTS
jgi:Na+/melibiose symporter-like transporter